KRSTSSNGIRYSIVTPVFASLGYSSGSGTTLTWRLDMKNIALAFVICVGVASAQIPQASKVPTQPNQQAVTAPNPNIDMDGYLKVSAEAAKHRQTRRLTEKDFLAMSAEDGTVVLDARSKEKYDLLHIKGAVNLSFPDITIESLKKTFPDKDTRILI